jgi:hypothetical protein
MKLFSSKGKTLLFLQSKNAGSTSAKKSINIKKIKIVDQKKN